MVSGAYFVHHGSSFVLLMLKCVFSVFVLVNSDGSGSKVPAVARSTRDAILSEATRRGLSTDCLREATARNICSLILQQNNRHTVVFVVSPEKVSGPLNISLWCVKIVD